VILLLMMPLVTMRLFAEERRSGTIELLLTYPVRDGAVLVGKYLGALTLYALMLAGTLFYPVLLTVFRAQPEWGTLATGYLGLLGGPGAPGRRRRAGLRRQPGLGRLRALERIVVAAGPGGPGVRRRLVPAPLARSAGHAGRPHGALRAQHAAGGRTAGGRHHR